MALLACGASAMVCGCGNVVWGPKDEPYGPPPPAVTSKPAPPAATQPAAVEAAPAGRPAPLPAPVRSDKPTRQQTDELEELSKMLLDRPSVPITTPAGRWRRPRAVVKLPPDGSMVVDRVCWVRRDETNGWTVLEFGKDPQFGVDVPRRVLPCGLLAKLEEFASHRPAKLFRVSGENTTYKGACYILLRKLLLAPPPAPPPRRPAPAAGASGAERRPAATAPAAGPPAAPPGPEAPSPPGRAGQAVSPETIVAKLLTDKPGRPVTLPPTAPLSELEPQPSVVP